MDKYIKFTTKDKLLEKLISDCKSYAESKKDNKEGNS
jgi:hypothetical protein